MKKFIILTCVIFACLFNVKAQNETYWNPDYSLYPNNMTVTAVISFNETDQNNMELELGAFCGEELRGGVRPMYLAHLDKYIYFLMVYGNPNDNITFKVYDHGTQEVMDLMCSTEIAFEVNGTFGNGMEPYNIGFTTKVDVTAVSDPEEGGVITGAGSYHVGENVSLTATANEGFFFMNWTENEEVVSEASTYSFVIEEAVGFPAVRNITAHFGELSVPANLSAEVIDAQSIALSWDAAENALSYNVYRGEEFVANVTETSYTNTGLAPFTDYCFTVTSVRGELETAASEEACAKTLDLPVATPTNVTATAVDTQSIALSWDAMENALSYNVYKGEELLGNVTTNSYTDEGLNHYTEYCYTVTTVRNEQETEPSDEVCVKTMDLPIAAPTNFTAEAIDTQSIALSWDAMENALSYNVYKGEELLGNVTETSYTDEGLDSFTEYCYTVTTVRNESESEESEACAMTLDLTVATPANLTATAIDTQSIALSWDAAENALSYNIYRGEEVVANVTEVSYTDEGLNSFTEYCYTVTAIRNEQESEASNEACAMTLDLTVATPTNFTATAIDTQSIALSWDAAENALSYNVYRGEEFVANVTETSYTDEGLDSFTEYCYTVTAIRNEQESEESEACAMTLDLTVATPANLTATAIDTQSIALSWDAAENALSYNIYKGEELLGNVTETSYTDEGLEYDTEYCYSVTAVRNEQESEKSEVVCIKTLGESINEYTVAFNIYPNPVDETLFIDTESNIEEVALFNVTGVMVYNLTSLNNNSIDLSNVAKGAYIIRIITDNGAVNYSRILVK